MTSPYKTVIEEAVDLLLGGEVVALPTETVYGLAGDACNPEAVAKIFAIKQRPSFDPLIVHALDVETARMLVTAWPEAAERLAAAFWPGPLTLVLPKKQVIPDLVTSGLPYVAVRVPAHPVMRMVLEKFGAPLAAPSANRFGRISPTTAEAVREELGDAVLILNGGPCTVGLESTIIGLTDAQPVLLRAGGLPLEEIIAVIGPVKKPIDDEGRAVTPGSLKSHYAPGKPLTVVGDVDQLPQNRSEAGLLTWGVGDPGGYAEVRNLSRTCDAIEAAVNFFRMLRELDSAAVREIHAVELPPAGLGLAINDRLRRASRRDSR